MDMEDEEWLWVTSQFEGSLALALTEIIIFGMKWGYQGQPWSHLTLLAPLHPLCKRGFSVGSISKAWSTRALQAECY